MIPFCISAIKSRTRCPNRKDAHIGQNWHISEILRQKTGYYLYQEPAGRDPVTLEETCTENGRERTAV